MYCGENRATCGMPADRCKPCANALMQGRWDESSGCVNLYGGGITGPLESSNLDHIFKLMERDH